MQMLKRMGDRTLPCGKRSSVSPSATLIVRFHIEPPTGQHVLDDPT